MRKIFSKWLPCATLAAWSTILLYFYFSGHIHALLHPTFRPFALVAGIILAVLAACFAFLPMNIEACADDVSTKSFGRKTSGRVLTFLILLAPICAAATFTTDSYGLSTVLNRGVVDSAAGLTSQVKNSTPYVEPPLPSKDNSQPAQADTSSQPAASPDSRQQASSQPPPPQDDSVPRDKDGNLVVQVVDLLYAAQDTSMRGDFKNQTISMIGQLMPDTSDNPKGDRFKLVRMFMVCCAADARPVAVAVESDIKPKGEDMSWIKVVGTVEFPVENGRPVAIVKATKVMPTDPPEETMLY